VSATEPLTEEWLMDRAVVCPSGCWLWAGADSGLAGRGSNYAKARGIGYVHVAAWVKRNGPVPAGHQVHHACAEQSPQPWLNRRCVRPDHLECISASENQKRKKR
jgi:hypothetical protein